MLDRSMVIKRTELEQTKLAKETLEAAELAAEKARSAYHASIGQLATTGATVREIGSALGMSHQRVHQILGTLCCSFCGTPRESARRLISGPRVFICDVCILRARAAVRDQPAEGFVRGAAKASCDFCGLRVGEGWLKRNRPSTIVSARDHRICNKCVELSIDILAA